MPVHKKQDRRAQKKCCLSIVVSNVIQYGGKRFLKGMKHNV